MIKIVLDRMIIILYDIAMVDTALVSVTDFRRNAGSYFDGLMQGKSYTLIKSSSPIGRIVPLVNFIDSTSNLQKDLVFFENLSKKYTSKKSLTPDQLNAQYDKIYDQMLPR